MLEHLKLGTTVSYSLVNIHKKVYYTKLGQQKGEIQVQCTQLHHLCKHFIQTLEQNHAVHNELWPKT